MRVIRGKKALVTGAASGIGRAIALRLAEQGADLHLLDINGPALERVVQEAAARHVAVTSQVCDLSDPQQLTASVRALPACAGPIDLLVNNAGVLYYGPTENMSSSHWQRMLAINLRAPVQLACELLPTLLSRPEAHVLNVASMSGYVGLPHSAGYAATKFGMLGFSESLRAEFAARGLGVTCLCPGVVRTSIWDGTENGMPLLPNWTTATPEKVAQKAVQGILRNRRLVLVTPLAHLLYYLHRFAPGLLALATRLRRAPTAAPTPAADHSRKAA
jgi:short-subunit dehydrogenase